MMALPTLINRLYRSSPRIFPSPYIYSLAFRSLPSSPANPLSSFIRPFRRTPLVPSIAIPFESCFSTLQTSHDQNIHEIIKLDQFLDEPRGRNRSGIVEFVGFIKGNANNFTSEDGEAIDFLDQSGVRPSTDIINSSIWDLKSDWNSAFLVFKWGEKWGCNDNSVRMLMIWVLGNHKKFSTAWCLIRELRRSSMDTQQAILIMIDSYAAANNPCKAIRTFQIMEKFGLSPDQRTFYTLLHILCKHGNIEEAEEFMLQNKKFFPLETDGFNILLNGWCNISTDILEAKRIWREMSKNCILPNTASYNYMISGFSKARNLFDSLRVYDEMRKRGWVPGLEVYNSLISVLAQDNCLEEALKFVEKIKETGLRPDANTYNSMIIPLCETSKLEEARTVLAMMMGENISPTIETYHAFLETSSLAGAFEILNRMKKNGFAPKSDSFVLILERFLKAGKPESALRIWFDMKEYEVMHDCEHYDVLVKGLVKCGLLAKARDFYNEMKFKGFGDDPKLKKLFKEPCQIPRDAKRRNHEEKRVIRSEKIW